MTISVIIPVWNRATLLKRALLSVLAQTVAVNEIIVVDDGSDDAPVEVLDDICAGANVQLYVLPHCGMVGKVRNYGIAHAKGEWIAFLDSDDEWLPNKIELQCRLLDNSDFLWCHTREIWNRKGKIISQRSQNHKRQGDVFADALVKCIIGPSTVLLHKRLFEECGLFSENLEIAEDYDLWLRICNLYNIGFVDESLTIKHAGHGGQLSEKYDYIEKFRITALESLLKESNLSYNNTVLAKQELLRKQTIWQAGLEKRQQRLPSSHRR